jgi:hypothetical protein
MMLGVQQSVESYLNDEGKRFKVMRLSENTSSILSWANDEGFERIFVEQLKNFASPGDGDGDVVIAMSGSRNVLRAIEWANHAGLRNPTCGDEVTVQLRITKELIESAWFTAGGCLVSRAAASMLCQHVEGISLEFIRKLTRTDMLSLIDVPPAPHLRPTCAPPAPHLRPTVNNVICCRLQHCRQPSDLVQIRISETSDRTRPQLHLFRSPSFNV